MSGRGVELRLDVGVELDAEAAELDEATSQLWQELLELDVEAVERLAGEAPPPGTRAAEATLLGRSWWALAVRQSGRLRVVEAPGYDDLLVNHHELVMNSAENL